MPAGDGTGPNGMGAMTGRAAGYCAGYGAPGYVNGPGVGRAFGMGRGRGFGRGFGFRRGFGGIGWGFGRAALPYGAVAPTADQELEVLRQQAEGMEASLTDIRGRIEELEKSGK